MTFREKLADWISGGAITYAKGDAAYWRKVGTVQSDRAVGLHNSLFAIHAHTAPQKSGTAKKVARMCSEALGE